MYCRERIGDFSVGIKGEGMDVEERGMGRGKIDKER